MMVSIIMPTCNKCDYLKLTLAGFTKQTFKDFEIVIVNDGSTDDTAQVVRKYQSVLNIKYISQENRGRSAARNVALEQAEGEYYIFSDDDRIPDIYFVQSHYDFLKDNKDYASIGIKKEILSKNTYNLPIRAFKYNDMYKRNPECYEAIVIRDEKELIQEDDLINNYDEIINRWSMGEAKDNQSKIYEEWGNELKGFEFGWTLATTANLGFCAEKYQTLRFDENYKGWGMEDTDFAYQMYKEGAMFSYLPQAINYHQIHSRSESAYSELRDNVRLFAKKYSNMDAYFFVLSFKYILSISDANRLYAQYKQEEDEKMKNLIFKMAEIISES